MKKLLVILLAFLLALNMVGCSDENSNVENNQDSNIDTNVENNKEFDWKATFGKYNLSDEDIEWMQEVMNNVGIYEVDLLENTYTDCTKGLYLFRSKFLDSINLQLNFTIEDGKLFYVSITGIPTTKPEAYIGWDGKVKFKTTGTTMECVLYYDYEGGYVAYYDAKTNSIITYDNK